MTPTHDSATGTRVESVSQTANMNAQSWSFKCGDCGRSFANSEDVRAHIARRGCVDERFVQLGERERGRRMKRLIEHENDDDYDYDDKVVPDNVEQQDNSSAVQHNADDDADAGESIDTAVGRVAEKHAKNQNKRRGPSIPRESSTTTQAKKKKKKKNNLALSQQVVARKRRAPQSCALCLVRKRQQRAVPKVLIAESVQRASV